jgi:hypothetical protein
MGFVAGIEEGYRDPAVVTYHNALHACDVVQNCYFMLMSSTLSEMLQPDDVFLALLSGALHDYQHPGIDADHPSLFVLVITNWHTNRCW